MEISDKGTAETGSYEGLILTPYLDDVNVKTIGFGATSSDIPDLHSWPWDKTITIPEAVSFFKKHLVKYQEAVEDALHVMVEQYQFDALVSFTYNLGVGIVHGKLFQLINENASLRDIGDCFLEYNHAKGRVLQGLTNRRKAEALLYKDGYYKSGGIIELNTANPVTHKEHFTGQTINIYDYL